MSLSIMSAELSAAGVSHRVVVVAAGNHESLTEDKHTQETFAKRLVAVAEAVGFNKTKVFVSKDADDKYVVYAYLARIGDDMDAVDRIAYRLNADVVTEYHPSLVKSRGLENSKIRSFNISKLKRELAQAFKEFIKQFGD